MGRRILTDAGYEVITVNNGSAALKKIHEVRPDLIILDVYMPGYGGLEVCQRLKESGETMKIPVLLSVGKLEPFKADEAKRVRADAHLVKPFEATELLAVLTRLEDKLVPQGGTAATAKSAKGKASEKAGKSKDKQYGDSESGWKQRLTIPPASKQEKPKEGARREREKEEIAEAKLPAASTAFREISRPAAENEVAASEGLPPDITAEEIAAITSAAAAF